MAKLSVRHAFIVEHRVSYRCCFWLLSQTRKTEMPRHGVKARSCDSDVTISVFNLAVHSLVVSVPALFGKTRSFLSVLGRKNFIPGLHGCFVKWRSSFDCRNPGSPNLLSSSPFQNEFQRCDFFAMLWMSPGQESNLPSFKRPLF